jgi:hypothetical protein
LREIAELGEDGAARLRRERLVHDPILGAFLDRKTASRTRSEHPRLDRSDAIGRAREESRRSG